MTAGGHTIAWGDVPTWVAAIATTLAFVAASAAAWFTKGSLDEAKTLASQSKADAEYARTSGMEQLARSEKTEERLIRGQLDVTAATVYGRVQLLVFERRLQDGQWKEIEGTETLARDEVPIFRMRILIELENCSDLPALIDADWLKERPLFLRPRTSSPGLPITSPLHVTFETGAEGETAVEQIQRFTFFSSNLAETVRDEFCFDLDVRCGRWDGSRFEVQVPSPWTEKISFWVERTYPNLSA